MALSFESPANVAPLIFVALGFLLLIYMKPVDCRKILIWLSWDQVERIEDSRTAWDTCLKSLLLHVTDETVVLWCFSWTQFIALCLTSNHQFRYWRGVGGQIKNHLNHLSQAQLKSLSLTPVLPAFVFSVSLAFTKSCIQFLPFPLVRWQVTEVVGVICTLPCLCFAFLSGGPLVLWPDQCHYSWWHWATVPSGMCLFQLGSSVELSYFRGVPALAGLNCRPKSS